MLFISTPCQADEVREQRLETFAGAVSERFPEKLTEVRDQLPLLFYPPVSNHDWKLGTNRRSRAAELWLCT